MQAGDAAILPLAAGAKQHGVHLPTATDQIQADYFFDRLAGAANALI